MVWLGRRHLAFSVANCVLNLRFAAALLDAAATSGSCDGLLASNMTENALSILIVIFSVQLQQTKISKRKLFIFHHGTWWGRWKSQGHRPHPPSHGKWWKACINICKHILKFSNCVLLRVPINNNNYEQQIALFVIILAKKHHESPWCNLMLAPTRQQGRGLEDTICICSCQLCIKLELYLSTRRSYVFYLQLLGIELITNFVYQTNNNHWATGWLLTRLNNNLKQL